jgi:hypothetical protein
MILTLELATRGFVSEIDDEEIILEFPNEPENILKKDEIFKDDDNGVISKDFFERI